MCDRIEEVENGSDYYALLIASADGKRFHVTVFERNNNDLVQLAGTYISRGIALWAARRALEEM